MILVRRELKGKVYTEPFSKGILSRTLIRAELNPSKAYEIANKIESDLTENDISSISTEDIVKRIVDLLEEEDPLIAENYLNWRKIRKTDAPLIILIGGVSGVGTSSISYEISRKLGIESMMNTDMIREVMRKIVSKELSPVIHQSSFIAHEALRVAPPPEFDYVLAGFKDHVGTVSVGVEAVIERALTEGISIIIEGVHIVPGFIRKDLMEKDNVLMFVLSLEDEEMHKSRLYSRCSDGWAHRSLQKYLDNFDAIRKIQMYIKDQGKKEGVPVIENIDRITTIDFIINSIAETYGGLNNVRKDKSAFEKLMKHKISAMPVVDNGKMVGIVTATDLGHNLILDHYQYGTKVKSAMVKDVACVSSEDTIKDAVSVMFDKAPGDSIINQLPVVDDGELVGIISDGDIIKILKEYL